MVFIYHEKLTIVDGFLLGWVSSAMISYHGWLFAWMDFICYEKLSWMALLGCIPCIMATIAIMDSFLLGWISFVLTCYPGLLLFDLWVESGVSLVIYFPILSG